MSRLTLKVVSSYPLGNCLIIGDTETGKNIEVMAVQLQSLVRSGKTTGSFPHGGWDRTGDEITIHHDEDRENREVSFTIEELGELL